MLVWRNLVLEPNFDSFWFQTRLNRDFIFWSFICTMIDTQTQIRGLNKSNWLQNWEYSQIMLVWHLSLTQSQMLYLWKCDRPMSKVIFCILKQRTCRCKTQKRNHQQKMYCHTNIFEKFKTVPAHFSSSNIDFIKHNCNFDNFIGCQFQLYRMLI